MFHKLLVYQIHQNKQVNAITYTKLTDIEPSHIPKTISLYPFLTKKMAV